MPLTAVSMTRSGMRGQRLRQGLGLEVADVAGEAVVQLVAHLLAGDRDLLGVDDDQVVARVHVRGELGLCLPRRRRASSELRRPRVLPAASTTYQSCFTVAGLVLTVMAFMTGSKENRGK
jgi:hypothetical protein